MPRRRYDESTEPLGGRRRVTPSAKVIEQANASNFGLRCQQNQSPIQQAGRMRSRSNTLLVSINRASARVSEVGPKKPAFELFWRKSNGQFLKL